MKILILNDSTFIEKAESNILSINDVNSYNSVYCFYVIKYLKKYKNVELVYGPIGSSDKNIKWNNDNLGNKILEADHCIAFSQRTFLNRDISFYNEIRKKVKGKITTICDNNYNIGPEDCTFFSVGYPDERYVPKSLKVGWAADPENLFIQKNDSCLNILIDHSYYGISEYVPDYSKLIIEDVCKFAKKYKNNLNVRRFISGGVEDLDINNPKFEIYDRNGLSFKDCCKEYNRSHIFIVTHEESLGLSVIEAAMAGALILVPNDPNKRGSCIKPWLIKPLNHVMFNPNDGIPWNSIIKNNNIFNNRKRALKFNYKNVTKKMIEYLEN